MDMVLNFMTPYMNDSRTWVTDPKSIRINYLRGWFTVDFLSVLPIDVMASFSRTR
jgi:hypothetical protein